MSRFALGNLFLAASIGCAALSQVLLKGVLRTSPPGDLGSLLSTLLGPGRFGRSALALALVASGFVCWLQALSRLDLSYAYPVACASILVVALLSWLVLGEPLSIRAWIGTLLVLAGVALLAPGR
jgi:multidrug transporter EmrE-like cation transporter